MATIEEIQNFLDIEIGERRLRDGKKKTNKNSYYYYENQYYIVQLTKNKWITAEDCNKTRILLRLHSWCVGTDGYAMTSINGTTKMWHQLFLTYEDGLEGDHINRLRYDNRSDNLRIVTRRVNNRNRTKPDVNTSGVKGVHLDRNGKKIYWKAQIQS